MYAVRAWDRSGPMGINWAHVVAMEEVWSRHELTRPAHLCMTYFRRYPTCTMERTPFLWDEPFRDLLRGSRP